jgi:hypothetical protein
LQFDMALRSDLDASVQCAARKVPFSRQAVTFFHLHRHGALARGAERGQIMSFPNTRNAAWYLKELCATLARKRGGLIALTLRDVRCDPIANRALDLLMHDYTVAAENCRLVLTKKTGDLKLFVNELDDLRQLDFIHNQAMVRQIERLRTLLIASNEHRERWKVRALMAEALLLEATVKTSNNDGRRNVSDARYAALKRFLAKRFHPDYAPGGGIEKIVRSEIFKEIWNEIERLDEEVSASRFATAASRSAA